MFLQLLGHHFPPSNKLHKIFNNNAVKVSYCCTQNIASVIKSHNKKVINTSKKNTLPCNCRKKHEVPQMAKVELRILYTNALPQYTGILTKFIQVPQVISNNVFTTTECHLTMRANPQTQHFPNIFDNAITKMVHNQISTSLFKYFQKMSVVSARKI